MTDEERENLCECDISVLQVGNRLQITADVDAKGIATLKEMLTEYEGILELLAGVKQKPVEPSSLTGARNEHEGRIKSGQ